MQLDEILLFLTICGIKHVSTEPSCSPQFKCDAANPENYQIHGITLTCPVQFVCNADYDPTSCDACVPLNEATCGYKCDDLLPNQGTINGQPVGIKAVTFTCPTGKVCNKEYLDSCAPCIDIVCQVLWTCNVNNPTDVIISGLNLQCTGGKICNKDYIYPCDACIIDVNVPSTTSTTIKPNPGPGQYPPNCNDGFGGTVPCRPGPQGSNFYYKCFRVGMVFDFSVKLCSNIAGDLCRNYANICK